MCGRSGTARYPQRQVCTELQDEGETEQGERQGCGGREEEGAVVTDKPQSDSAEWKIHSIPCLLPPYDPLLTLCPLSGP